MITGHLLSAADLTKDEALNLLATAKELAAITDGPNKKLPTLRGKTIVNLFFEDSTRTRISFETAAKRLSADVINFSAKGSSISKGESLKDTAQTLQAMGADAVVIRHGSSGAAKRLADTQWIQAAVINAGDGTHEHPTQALLDAFTIKQHLAENKKDLSGLRVLIVGDILHSRVARSNVLLLTKLGAEVVLVAPPTLLPVGVSDWAVTVSYDLDSEIEKFTNITYEDRRLGDPPALVANGDYAKDILKLNQRIEILWANQQTKRDRKNRNHLFELFQLNVAKLMFQHSL